LGVSYSSSSTNISLSSNVVTILGAGTASITASQPGNTNWSAAAPVTTSFKIQCPQSIVFNPITNQPFSQLPIPLNATASSSLPISYSVISGPATINGNQLTLTGLGTVTIAASQSGNDIYFATNQNLSFKVTKGTPRISFTPIAPVIYGTPPFTLNATSSSGETIHYTSSNTKVAKVIGSVVTILGAGSTTITASQSGSTNWNAAAPVQVSLIVNLPTQTISFNLPKTVAFALGHPVALTGTDSAGLPITYTSSNPKVLSISGTKAVMKSRGTATITASQRGNALWQAATPITQTVTLQ